MGISKEFIQNIRQDYKSRTLSKKEVALSPIEQFGRWFEEALKAEVREPNAMSLATVDINGKPSSRIVLLKGFDTSGFNFYTNYNSRKGQQILTNPWVALTIFWPELERQVRIEGKAEMISAEDSDSYFHSRPKGSQLAAVASPQSETVAQREILDKKWTELEIEHAENDDIARPPHWGGYRVCPYRIEFWQGRCNRLHDRILYLPDGNDWKPERLAP